MKKWMALMGLVLLAASVRAADITLGDFKLTGDLGSQGAEFTLTGVAHVTNSSGGRLPLLSGPVALLSFIPHGKEQIHAKKNSFYLTFDRRGDFPVQVKFAARVRQSNDWNSVNFATTPGLLQPITLRGLATDTIFDFPGAARPERHGTEFTSYLPTDGAVKFSWKSARAETEGKLFFSGTMLEQASVSPGLMRQVAVLDFKVMQGELSRIVIDLQGPGEVTRVQGDQVLAWNVETISNSSQRKLVVQFNQPQKDQFACQIQGQTPLSAFPQTVDLLQMRPENAIQFSGCARLVNDGAVRLEVVHASGTSQISPEQFPETEATKAAFRDEGKQRFAYRFADANFALRVHADQVLPELSISELLGYRVTENELSLDADLELDIREAPLRELIIDIPKGYAVARLNAPGLSDYFLTEPKDASTGELRLVYGQPVTGRQLVQLRLEHNQGLAGAEWNLPPLEFPQAKSMRGYIGVAADAGYRLAVEKTKSLTDTATAFFPGKLEGIQAAFRLNDSAWEATFRVERLPQTVQADMLHLFSIGEGVAYGSSVINYVVSGAPESSFRIDLSSEYENVEFTGKDLRNWQKVEGGYVVQLHTSVTGPYTLLATYERPFTAHGETLSFTGARPLDAQSEEGYTLVTSANQFDVKRADVSANLLPLEPAEVPAEYRLFFDAPVLAAYRYSARPFNLKLTLSPLVQGDSLSQIVDRASLDTHISKEGQILTDVRYFIKSRGNPHFRVTIPEGSQLWAATINGAAVVPVEDGKASLIPLPQNADPNAVLQMDLKLAAQSANPNKIRISTPVADAPVMLAEWKLTPEDGQRLIYEMGSVMPFGGVPDVSGFAQLTRLFASTDAKHLWIWLLAALATASGAMVIWRRALRDGLIWGGVIAVTVLMALSFLCLTQLHAIAETAVMAAPVDLNLLAPIQQAGTALTVAVSNIADKTTWETVVRYTWPAALAVAALIASRWIGFIGSLAGWTLLAWAALRMPDGAALACWVLAAFLAWTVLIPIIVRVLQLPRANPPSLAPATATLIVGGLFLFTSNTRAASAILPDSVAQSIRIEHQYVFATATIRFHAEKGQIFSLPAAPSVLTRLTIPPRAFLVQNEQLIAQVNGSFNIELEYEQPATTNHNKSSFVSAIPYGVINQLDIKVVDADVDVLSAQAVSIRADRSGTNTIATLILAPGAAIVSWQPRHRDVKTEKPVFYAELTQLFVPTAGVVDGMHAVSIRPAQGELGELILDVPRRSTVTQVTGPAVSLWRFDPDAGKLRVTLSPPQSRPFAIFVQTQLPSGPLPLALSTGLISVENAAGEQIGFAGIATGNEVQLENITPNALSSMNLEDFPAETIAEARGQMPDITLRRAFRYAGTNATFTLQASAVQPDVRVESEDTLSLGEDRTILADNFTADITRAGIFELSFVLPEGFDVESVSGSALSQWTELKSSAGRVITLHLNGKTSGQQTFAISLTGSGIKTAHGWKVPQIVLREASKQRGSLLIVPEQGMRLQVAARDGYSQLDPQKSGVRQKGVLGFQALQAQANLTLDIEQVDPWIQVTSLQRAAISDAQARITANLQYQIENTGLKNLRVLLPTNATSVRFQGGQLADFAPSQEPVPNGLQSWQIKLSRRVIGQYLLQATYQVLIPNGTTTTSLRGVVAAGVNLQRGFVTVQSDPRLQTTLSAVPAALQPTEWQSIPRALQKDLPPDAANYAFRIVEPSFELPLKIQRHEAEKLLPAHVNNITMQSVISDDGMMLTASRLEIVPGDKRLLAVTLPPGSQFWFAFVNHNGAWPWREGDKFLVPMERQTPGNEAIEVEIYYSCRAGTAGSDTLDLALLAPQFELPLENITWRLSLGEKWQLQRWSGSFQLDKQEDVGCGSAANTNYYLQNELNLSRIRAEEAQRMLALGNASLDGGDPHGARRAFAAAYGLSAPDAAFNEDARVQLHNVKLQEALVGLNACQSATTGDVGALGGKMRDLRNRKEMNYTQQDAKDIIDVSTADENAAFMRLAERLVQQQDAAVNNPAGIRASIPEEGRELTFKRAVAVEPWANLDIQLHASASSTASRTTEVTALAGIAVIFVIFARRRPDKSV